MRPEGLMRLRLGFAGQLGLLLAVVIGGVFGAVNYQAYRQETHALVQNLEGQIATFLAAVQPHLAEKLRQGDHDALRQELEMLQALFDRRGQWPISVEHFAVLDADGRVISANSPAPRPPPAAGLGQERERVFPAPAQLDVQWRPDYSALQVSAPLQWEGRTLGSLRGVFAAPGIQAQLQTVDNGFFKLFVLTLLVSAVLGVVITRWLSRPLKAVTHELNRLGSGTLSLPGLHRRKDEYGALARALERADRRVHEATRELTRENAARRDAETDLHAFKTTLDLTFDCVFMFEPDSLRFFYANRGAMEQIGYSRQELLTLSPVAIKPEFDEARFRATIKPLLDGRLPYLHFETVHRHKQGHDIPVEIVLQYIHSPLVSPRFVAIVRDISERRASEAELHHYHENLEAMVRQRTEDLEAARREAEQASQAKSEFLSRMSHELRTPMNAILGFAQIIETDEQEPPGPNQRENVAEILAAGEHLMTLIDEVLDLSRIEAGRLEVSLERVSVVDVAQASLALVRHQAQARGISLNDRIGDARLAVRADFTRLRQVLVNLLSNAIKYNRPDGSVTLSCDIVDDAALRLKVRDTGRGIKAQDMARLFKPFERLQVEPGIEGTGIGLVVSRRLVEMMNGRLEVESAVGKGSLFTVELPLLAAAIPEEKAL